MGHYPKVGHYFLGYPKVGHYFLGTPKMEESVISHFSIPTPLPGNRESEKVKDSTWNAPVKIVTHFGGGLDLCLSLIHI